MSLIVLILSVILVLIAFYTMLSVKSYVHTYGTIIIDRPVPKLILSNLDLHNHIEKWNISSSYNLHYLKNIVSMIGCFIKNHEQDNSEILHEMCDYNNCLTAAIHRILANYPDRLAQSFYDGFQVRIDHVNKRLIILNARLTNWPI